MTVTMDLPHLITAMVSPRLRVMVRKTEVGNLIRIVVKLIITANQMYDVISNCRETVLSTYTVLHGGRLGLDRRDRSENA